MDSSPRAIVRSPFPNHAWPSVWKWIQPYKSSVMDDHSAKTIDEFVEAKLELAAKETYRTWGVYRENDLGGLITFETLRPGDTMGWTHTMFKRAFFGRETTQQALSTVFQQLFEEGVQVIRSEVFKSNSNIRYLSRLIGFEEYGPFPKVAQRGGELVDMVGLLLTPDKFHADRTDISTRPRRQQHRRRLPGGPRPQHDQHFTGRTESGAAAALDEPEHPTPGQPIARRTSPQRSTDPQPGTDSDQPRDRQRQDPPGN